MAETSNMISMVTIVTPGALGITDGRPVVVDPTDATKAVSTDKLVSITTKLLGVALSERVDDKVVVALSGIVPDAPTTLTAYTDYWAAAGGNGYTTSDPGGGEADPLYLGFPVASGEFYVSLAAFRLDMDSAGIEAAVSDVETAVDGVATAVGDVETAVATAGGDVETAITTAIATGLGQTYEDWASPTLTFSAGDAATMPNAATAIVTIEPDTMPSKYVDLAWGFTFGAAPSADAALAVYQSYDNGTNIETNPSYNFTEALSAGNPVKRWRRIAASDAMRLVLTNSTGQDITSVWLKWRGVRG